MTTILSIIGALIVVSFSVFAGKKTLKIDVEKVPYSVMKWKTAAMEAGQKYNIPPDIILAQIWQESAGDEFAEGGAGEIGLMQLKKIAIEDIEGDPKTAAANISDWKTNPRHNIKAGTAYLSLMRKREANMSNAIEAYNQGGRGRTLHPERAKKYLGEITEKRKYFNYG